MYIYKLLYFYLDFLFSLVAFLSIWVALFLLVIFFLLAFLFFLDEVLFVSLLGYSRRDRLHGSRVERHKSMDQRAGRYAWLILIVPNSLPKSTGLSSMCNIKDLKCKCWAICLNAQYVTAYR